ncbi:MAG: L-threonylcarbamoyladenylate synthase [Pyrinomonadaceae bacterium]
MIIANSRQVHEVAALVISGGGVIAFRTDTFYGLGANPLNPLAVGRIRKLKSREEFKPILLLVSDEHQVDRFIAERSPVFAACSRRFWPGPLTIVGKAVDELPGELTAGSGTIGIRLPDDQSVRGLVRACGGALTATSANVSGRLSARTAAEVAAYFSERIDLIVDGGEVTATLPSTVLDLSKPEPRLLREGAIVRADLNEFLGGMGLSL